MTIVLLGAKIFARLSTITLTREAARMTSVQSVSSVVQAATNLAVLESRYLQILFLRPGKQIALVAKVPEHRVSEFSLELDREVKKLNNQRGLGLATENPQKRAVTTSYPAEFDEPPGGFDIVEAPPVTLAKMGFRKLFEPELVS